MKVYCKHPGKFGSMWMDIYIGKKVYHVLLLEEKAFPKVIQGAVRPGNEQDFIHINWCPPEQIIADIVKHYMEHDGTF